jgi:transcriptional regulator with XRE-family HTH domain
MRNSGTAELNAGAARGSFGDHLRALRTARGLTLAQAAEAAGMSLSAYRLIEMGGRSAIGAGELKRVAEALGEKPAAVIGRAVEAGY